MKAVLAFSVAAAALLVASAALAAGSITITSGQVVLGEQFTFEACGFPTPTSISFEVTGPRKSGIHYFTAGEPLDSSDGCATETWTAWWSVAGSYQITSYYRNDKGMTKKVAVLKFDAEAL